MLSWLYRDNLFENGVELVPFLRQAEETPRCVVLQSLRNATGHVTGSINDSYVDDLNREFVASGHDYRTLMAKLVSSEAFRFASGFLEEIGAAEEE